MTTRWLFWIPIVGSVCACATKNSDGTQSFVLSVPPSVSSLDATLPITATLSNPSAPLSDLTVRITLDFTDANGIPRVVGVSTSGTFSSDGSFQHTFSGLGWKGTGSVTADVLHSDGTPFPSQGAPVHAVEPFQVIDLTPPQVAIAPPTQNLKTGPGLPFQVPLRIADEIGLASVGVSVTGAATASSSLAFSAVTTTSDAVTFRIDVPTAAPNGASVTVTATATDSSGNVGTDTVVLAVDTSIAIAVPPGMTARKLVEGTTAVVANPRGIAFSPKDGQLYITDAAASGACTPSCLWSADATSGAVGASPVFTGTGILEGVAFHPAANDLYLSDRQNRIDRLTWNGSAYASSSACVNAGAASPQDPYHLAWDASLGILVIDDATANVVLIGTCAPTSVGAAFSNNPGFNSPRGIVVTPTGEILVSDTFLDEIVQINRVTGAATTFAMNTSSLTSFSGPYGMAWLSGGASPYSGSLFVANVGDRTIASTRGTGASEQVVFLQNPPIAIAVSSGALFIATSPSTTDPARVFRVDGF